MTVKGVRLLVQGGQTPCSRGSDSLKRLTRFRVWHRPSRPGQASRTRAYGDQIGSSGMHGQLHFGGAAGSSLSRRAPKSLSLLVHPASSALILLHPPFSMPAQAVGCDSNSNVTRMRSLMRDNCGRGHAWIVIPMLLLGTARAHAQRPEPVAAQTHRVVMVSDLQTHARTLSQSATTSATAKGVGIGLLMGALAGVAVGATIESGNEDGSPQTRDRYRGFGYAVFVPLGAVVGGVVGGILGARKH
jgi:hypothetical protein